MSAQWFALLAQQAAPPLVRQFVHDSRTDVIKYSANDFVSVTGLPPSEPYRNGDVGLLLDNSGSQTTASLEFRFGSGGGEDERLWGYGVAADGNPVLKVYLNNALVAEVTPGGEFLIYSGIVRLFEPSRRYAGGDLYADPMLEIAPPRGLNVLRIVKPPSSGRLYFDGFGCQLRGGPIS